MYTCKQVKCFKISNNKLLLNITSTNAMKQTCLTVILHILPDFDQNHAENVAKTLKFSLLYTRSSYAKWEERDGSVA